MILHPPISTLFPYTTLFRSELRKIPGMDDVPVMFISSSQSPDIVRRSHEAGAAYYLRKPFDPEVLIELVNKALRSEEHTSELQSRLHLVCRLLLEKKKNLQI